MNPHKTHSPTHILAAGALLSASIAFAAQPTTLFEDDFTGGIPGWFAVKPAGAYIEDSNMLWQYDRVTDSFSEQSNIYTDSSAGSTSRRAVMLINETVAPAAFTYKARLTAGDDDGFGLIWGYENENTFYRVSFAWQSRTAGAWPPQGFNVDRMSDGAFTDIHGPDSSFIPTAGQPFDVVISVAAGALSLSITNDPYGTNGGPFVFTPLTAVSLPTAPSGRVGIFSWGMGGGNPRSFRVQNPVLSPTPLTGDPASTVLSNWSFTVTPSSTNDYPDPAGLWSQGLNANGDLGWMIENNDQAPENYTTSSTNTPVFAAVAGDVSWSNYVYSVRFQTSDNDGFGMFLRWQDRTNWYRISFRNQSSQAGIKYGTSVQKNVNRTFDQMLSTTAFIPPKNAPFDVHAAISGNILQLLCVQDPDGGSPTFTSLGPIDMGASTLVPDNLSTGKIGAFSWAQYRDAGTDLEYGTAVDSVKVWPVEGQGLFVASPYGTPDPPVGLNDFPAGTILTAKVDSVVISAPGVRQIVTGWSGGGSVPAAGTTNEALFVLNNLSSLTWKWRTEYLLTVNATAGGTAAATLGPWIDPGVSVTVTASASPGFIFTGWSGDNLSATPVLNLVMTRPITLTANFAADSDNDGLPDFWEIQQFGDLSQTGAGNPDGDDRNNQMEYELGTNPLFAEYPVLNDGLSSRWINVSRDRALPGWFVVTNFAPGFRGLWETSNQNRSADSAGPNDYPFITTTNYAANASFQGPYIVVRTNFWDPAWSTAFSLSAEYSVGDNDGICLYFRYLDASNWYRVTICGEATTGTLRPLQGVSIQKRTNGWFSAILPTSDIGSIPIDPTDTTGYKRLRVTVNGTNDTFEVRVIGWDVVAFNPPDWNPSFERVITFTDSDIPSGRIGVGDWGMAAFGTWNATTNNPYQPGVMVNPVGAGAYVDNIVVQVNGTNAFVEDWETAPLHSDFPAGWDNPYAGGLLPGLVGDWHRSAHGTIANFTYAFGTPQTGTTEFPKGDVEGPILLAPSLTNGNFLLEVGIHPLDDGGIGFVYDFKDTNNYARVLFNARAPGAGDLLQGMTVGRKSNGTWTDIVVGDNAFLYAPGQPFDVRFANNNGLYTLSLSYSDAPATMYHWQWSDAVATASNRVGVAIWTMPDGHYTYVRGYALPTVVTLEITDIEVSGGNVTLTVSKPSGSNYDVLRASAVTGPYSPVATNQSGDTYTEALPGGTAAFYRLQLVP